MAENDSPITALFTQIATSARLGDVGTASSALNRSIPLIQEEIAAGKVPPEKMPEVAKLLGEVLAAQQRGDWIALADLFEYPLMDLMRR